MTQQRLLLLLLLLLFSLFLSSTNAHLCYSCYGETTNSTCFQNARSAGWVDCEKGECQVTVVLVVGPSDTITGVSPSQLPVFVPDNFVWSLYTSDSPSNIYMFERSCSGICQPGCVEISDMGHRFTSCSTCCSSNFCNIGSPSAAVFSLSFSITILSFSLFCLN